MGAKITIEDMQLIAESRGGRCLSEIYKNSTSKLEWQCSCGHIWAATPRNINSGSWCSYCTRKFSYTIEEVREIIKKLGGECLSLHYRGTKSKLKWKCDKGHVWEAPFSRILGGHWCPHCCTNNTKYTIEKVQETAQNKGGKCLSTEYFGIKHKLKWECSKGHIWEAPFGRILRGSWCLCCSGKAKFTIEKMQEVAVGRGGKCLSTEYNGIFSKLQWECSKGHIWEAMPNCVLNNLTWCPYCVFYKSEEVCRKYFETIFGCKFIRAKPDWLIGINGYKLELDGLSDRSFNGKYLAFEHDGIQHFIPTFNNKKKFETTKANDILKTKLCEENNVILFRIRQLFEKTKLQELKQIIKEVSVKNNIYVNVDVNIDLSNICAQDCFDKYKKIIENKNGKLLNSYINALTKLKILCDKGHVFEILTGGLSAGNWCPFCSSHAKLTIDIARDMAVEKGGLCLSDVYINSSYNLKWQCDKGHIWEANLNSIRSQGSWCPHCINHARLTINDARKRIEEKGGECLSDTYLNSKTKLKVKCSFGHIWEARIDNISSNHWCPYCSGRKKWEAVQNES